MGGAVFFSSYDSDSGVWSEPQTVVDADPSVESPRIAADGMGNLTLVWIQESEGFASVWGARRSSTTDLFGAPFLLELKDDEATQPQVAFNQDGLGIVVWWATDGQAVLGYNYFK